MCKRDTLFYKVSVRTSVVNIDCEHSCESELLINLVDVLDLDLFTIQWMWIWMFPSGHYYLRD